MAFGWGTGASALEFSITNTAYANFENEFSQVQPVTASSTSFGVVTGSPNLVVSAMASATAPWDGDPVYFTLAVFNAGDDSAFNVSVLDTLPALVGYAGSSTQSADPGWDPAAGPPDRLRWTLTEIGIGATAYIWFTGSGSAPVPDVQRGNSGISVHYGVTASASTYLAFEVWRSAPSSPGALSALYGGSSVALTWTPAGAGRDPVTGYLIYRSTGTGIPRTLYGLVNGMWSTGYLDALPEPNARLCYSVRAVDSAGRLGAEEGPVCVSPPIAPLLRLSGRVSPTYSWDGDSVTFMLTLFNGGDNSAFNISVLDTLPMEFRFAGIAIPPAAAGWNPASGPPERMLWSLNRLNIGVTAILRFTAYGLPPAGISGPGGANAFMVRYGSAMAATVFDAGWIWRSAPSAPPYLSALAGALSVELSWAPPAPGRDPVTGYLVYRATGTGLPLALVASSFGLWATGYSDPNPVAGAAMCYSVRSMDSAGRTSALTGPSCDVFGPVGPAGTVHLTVAVTDKSGRTIKILSDRMAASPVDGVSVADGKEYLSVKVGDLVSITLSDGTVLYWDARTSGGVAVPNGFYTVTVTSVLANGQVKKSGDTFALTREYEELIVLARFVPNPASEGVWLSYALASPFAEMKVRIYNIAGELVWKTGVTGASASFKWDLTNQQGVRVAPGLYIAALEAWDTATGMKSRKLLRLAVER